MYRGGICLVAMLFIMAGLCAAAEPLFPSPAGGGVPPPYLAAISFTKVLIEGSLFSVRVIVRDPSDGKPLQEVPVEISLRDDRGGTKASSSLSTDRNGTVSPALAVSGISGKGELLVALGSGGARREYSFPVTIEERKKIQLSLFETRTAEGSFLLARARVLKVPGGVPAREGMVTFLLVDPEKKTLFKTETPLGEGGVALARFPLTRGFAGGEYEMSALAGEAKSARKFRLTRAPLQPLIAVLEFDREAAVSGDTIQGTVKVLRPDGRPVPQAAIDLSITSRGAFEKLLAHLERTADGEGLYRFKSLVPSQGEGGKMKALAFTLKASRGGLTAEVSRELPVFSRPFFVNLLPERRELKRGLANKVTLLVTDREYGPYPLSVTVAGEGLSQPLATQVKGWATFEVTPPSSAPLHIRVKGSDGKGLTVDEEYTLPVEKGSDSLLVRADRSMLLKGESPAFTVLSTEARALVYLDLYSAGQLCATASLAMTEGHGRLVLPLDERLEGLIEVRASLGVKDGPRDIQWLYVSPHESLQINMGAMKGVYVPGEVLPLAIKVEASRERFLEVGLRRRAGSTGPVSYRRSNWISLVDPLPLDGSPDMCRALERAVFSDAIKLEGLRQFFGAALFLQLSPGEEAFTFESGGEEPPESDELSQVLERRTVMLLTGSRPDGEHFPEGARYGLAERMSSFYRKEAWPGDEKKEGRQAPPAVPIALPFDGSRRNTLPAVYYFDPSSKVAPRSTLARDILLPARNLQGELFAGSLDENWEITQKVTIFQEFLCEIPRFLEPCLVEGDSISLPVRLVNYLGAPRELLVEISKRDWFLLSGDREKKVTVPPYGEAFQWFPLTISRPGGPYKLAVAARSGGAYQEVRADCTVLPKAYGHEQAREGRLEKECALSFEFPGGAREEGREVFLDIYNSAASLLAEGAESSKKSLFVTADEFAARMLENAFLAGAAVPQGGEQGQKLRESFQQDYGSLLRFEKKGGGFSRYAGDETSGAALTAFVVMALKEGAKLSVGDEKMAARHVKWLFSVRRPDGSWVEEKGRGPAPELCTAMVTWALLQCGVPSDELKESLAYLADKADRSSESLTMALLAGILRRSASEKAKDAEEALLRSALSRGGFFFWQGSRSLFSGAEGTAADLEATALAVMALEPSLLGHERAVSVTAFFVGNRLPDGTWGTPFTTWLVAAALSRLEEGRCASGSLEVQVSGRKAETLSFPRGEGPLRRSIPAFSAPQGVVTLRPRVDFPLYYRLRGRYYSEAPASKGVEVARVVTPSRVKRGQDVEYTVTWKSAVQGPVTVTIPVPWSLEVKREALEALKGKGDILDYAMTGHTLSIVMQGKGGRLSIPFTAALPCRITVAPAEVRGYESPRVGGASPFAPLEIE
ncbi:MAG: hypothetical protein RDV48_09035 [Candidatus Eremiobacteraeota bacterium]|nr:hypothetical protein [Candidatus Eremiobacteraeota bacterium]